MTKKNKLHGFTLIELMITVAILGILSAVAIPSYMTYVTKSKRTEAKTELLSIAQLQENRYIQNLSYAKELNNGLGFSSAWQETENGLYKMRSQGLPLSCNGTSANPCTGYRVVAVPVSGKGQERGKECTEFYIDNTGFKGALSSTNTSNVRNSDTIKECWG